MANRHPKNWMSPHDRALIQQSFRLPQNTVDEITATKEATGLSKRRIIREAVHEYALRHGIKVPKPN